MKKGSSELLLLDVNVLLALVWPNHQFHRAAVRRLDRSTERWATCALTELGFIRLSSNPSVVGVTKSPAETTALLRLLVEDARHVYLGTLPSPTSARFRPLFEGILGPKQVTDAYLLALAGANQAKLVTFDVRLAAFHGAAGRVETLGEI